MRTDWRPPYDDVRSGRCERFTASELRHALENAERRADGLEHCWPALAQSWRRDVAELRRLLARAMGGEGGRC